MNEIEFEIKDLDNETRQEIAARINEGDGFWYCFNEGYIDPEKILADKEQLNKLNEALQIVRAFESLCNEIAEDYEEEEDCEEEDE